jgi:hypothetical protein
MVIHNIKLMTIFYGGQPSILQMDLCWRGHVNLTTTTVYDQNLHHHPLQFNLGELSTMSTIYDSKGEGWNKVPNIERYFCSDNPRDDNITIANYHFTPLILLMTVFEINKIILGKNMQKFWIRYSMRNYEWGNNAIRKRHPTLFKDKKDHYYSFGLSDELVQTLPFEFVANLKGGACTRLPSKWMSNIWSNLNQPQTNLITSIQVVRSLRPNNNLRGVFPLTVEPDENNCYIYEVFMEKSNFFVSHGQIYEIIGDEPWMDSEISCLCNVASGRKYGRLLAQRESPWIWWE